mgnify:CR=1 FL=1
MGNYYYLTRPKPKEKKITLEDILYDLITEADLYKNRQIQSPTTTRTNCYDHMITKNLPVFRKRINEYISILKDFYNIHKELDVFYDEQYSYEKQFEITNQLKSEWFGHSYSQEELDGEIESRLKACGFKKLPYYSFYIPKQKGGLRRIDAPESQLKEALLELKDIFDRMMHGNTYHTSAFAYIKNRSAKNVLDKLKSNKSRWLLKIDFSNFFGSIDIDFTMQQLMKIYPFCDICERYDGYIALKNCLKLCFLDGRLPQGTPISPLLTNIIMIPLDYKISNMLLKNAKEITTFDQQKEESNYRLIYTRYADDINIGSYIGFDYKKVISYIEKVIDEEKAPLKIKPQKTHYGNISGKNWVLGLMYNQDMNITVGHNRKRQLKAMIANFAMDCNNQKTWQTNDIQQVMGNISYVAYVEPEYTKKLIENMNEKFSMDILGTMRRLV